MMVVTGHDIALSNVAEPTGREQAVISRNVTDFK